MKTAKSTNGGSAPFDRQNLIRQEHDGYYLVADKSLRGAMRLTPAWAAVAKIIVEAAIALREQQKQWDTEKWQSEVSGKLDYCIGQNRQIIEMLQQMPEITRSIVSEELRIWASVSLKSLSSSMRVTLARVNHPSKMHRDDARQLTETNEGPEGIVNKTAALADAGPPAMFAIGTALLTSMSAYIPLCIYARRYKPSAKEALSIFATYFEDCETKFATLETDLSEQIKNRDAIVAGWPREFNLCRTIYPQGFMLGSFDGAASVTFRYGWDVVHHNDSDVPWFPGHNPGDFVVNRADEPEGKKVWYRARDHVAGIVTAYTQETERLRRALSVTKEFRAYTTEMLVRIREYQGAITIQADDYEVPSGLHMDMQEPEHASRPH